jgi:hypothetical protein
LATTQWSDAPLLEPRSEVRIQVVAKPVLQALILADAVYQDARSGKMIIAGTFNQLFARAFPARFGRTTCAYIKLTEVQGRVELVLRYRSLKTNEVLMESRPLAVASQNPLAVVEVAVEMPPFPMPEAGCYAFELHAGDEMLGALRIEVQKAKDLSHD